MAVSDIQKCFGHNIILTVNKSYKNNMKIIKYFWRLLFEQFIHFGSHESNSYLGFNINKNIPPRVLFFE